MDQVQLLKDCQSKNMKPIYLFHGEESYYIDLYSKIIEDHVLSDGEKAFNQTIMYGKDSKVSQIVDEAMQFPMMSSHRLIILKEAQDLKNIGDLNSYVENPNPQSILVLCHKNKKIDKRLKLVKNIEKQGIVFESKKLYDNELPKWVVNYTQLHQVNIENEAALMVAELLGNDLNKIANEMDKVFIGHDKSKKLTRADIQESIGLSKEYNVFELQKFIGMKDFVSCIRIVNYMGDNPKNNPLPMLLASLYSYFSKVFIASANMKSGDAAMMKALGLNSPYFLREYKSAASNYPYSKMRPIMNTLKIADLRSKGVDQRNMTESAILKEMIVQIFAA